jgi:drug/metabolite transporter (DMT)-like permease
MTAALGPYVGHAAGLATSLLWSMGALFFAAAGRRIGPAIVNPTRIGIATLLLAVTHRLLNGAWIPVATGRQVLLLALSGLVGLSIGDLALFTAFVRIGPRLAMLVMTTAPIFAALFGWLALGETFGPLGWLGMGLTIGGVAWVVLERPVAGSVLVGASRTSGLLLALVAAACQAGGLLLSKQGIGHGLLPRAQHLAPQTATLIRMFFAGLFVIPTVPWLVTRSRARLATLPAPDARGVRRAGYFFTFCGSLVGPFLGVWMSLVASDRAPLGIAQTLCSLPPVFILPFVILIHGERVSPRAALGACIAVAGTAVLFATPAHG